MFLSSWNPIRKQLSTKRKRRQYSWNQYIFENAVPVGSLDVVVFTYQDGEQIHASIFHMCLILNKKENMTKRKNYTNKDEFGTKIIDT